VGSVATLLRDGVKKAKYKLALSQLNQLICSDV